MCARRVEDDLSDAGRVLDQSGQGRRLDDDMALTPEGAVKKKIKEALALYASLAARRLVL